MQIFPFSHNDIILPQDLEQFKIELKKVTAKNLYEEHARVKFHGKLENDGFTISPKNKYRNFWRPTIEGTYNNDDKSIRVKLGVPKRGFIILGVWLLMVGVGILTSDAENKWFFASLILVVITVFWYLSGMLFYSIDIKKTKNAIADLKNLAEQTT